MGNYWKLLYFLHFLPREENLGYRQLIQATDMVNRYIRTKINMVAGPWPMRCSSILLMERAHMCWLGEHRERGYKHKWPKGHTVQWEMQPTQELLEKERELLECQIQAGIFSLILTWDY